jgi:hypothetical protein
MPCHDPKRAVKLSRERNFYKERHCPPAAEKLNCLIPSPPQYQRPIPWPESLRKIWYGNIPHTEVVQSKSSRHWVKKEGQYFVFPVDETNFPDGVGTYVQQLAQYIPFDTGAVRTALDIGCGVCKLCHFIWFLFCIGLAVNLTVSFLQGKLTFKLKFS